jgi:hypothetical protein
MTKWPSMMFWLRSFKEFFETDVRRLPAMALTKQRVCLTLLRLAGNLEVILKQAPGNRSDGFRSRLTRSVCCSVARPEICWPNAGTLDY